MMSKIERKEQMIAYRKSVNPATEQYYSLQEIGDIYHVSRERVRQIIGRMGGKKYPRENVILECGFCKKKFKKELQVRKNRKVPKFCSNDCKSRSRATVIKGKIKREFTKKEWREWREYHRVRSNTEAAKARRYRYFLKNKDAIYAYNREYIKEYKKRPEVRKKAQLLFKKRYHSDPIFREKNLEMQRAYQRKRHALAKMKK